MFSHAIADPAGMTDRAMALHDPAAASAKISHHVCEAADRSVHTAIGAHRVGFVLETVFLNRRAADDDKHARAASRHFGAGNILERIDQAFRSGAQHRRILRLAPRHNCRRCKMLRPDFDTLGRYLTDDISPTPTQCFKHGLNQ
jgi:hypothetical protein